MNICSFVTRLHRSLIIQNMKCYLKATLYLKTVQISKYLHFLPSSLANSIKTRHTHTEGNQLNWETISKLIVHFVKWNYMCSVVNEYCKSVQNFSLIRPSWKSCNPLRRQIIDSDASKFEKFETSSWCYTVFFFDAINL